LVKILSAVDHVKGKLLAHKGMQIKPVLKFFQIQARVWIWWSLLPFKGRITKGMEK